MTGLGISKKKLAAVLAAVATLVGLSIVGYKIAFAPVNGTISPHPIVSRATPERPVNKITNTLQGKHFVLEYSNVFRSMSDTAPQDRNAIEAYRLTDNQGGTTVTAVVNIKFVNKGGLTEESAYHMRKLQPDLYTEGSEQIGTTSFVVMKKRDASEVVGFSLHKDMLVTIAVSSSRGTQSTDETAATIMKKFQWTD